MKVFDATPGASCKDGAAIVAPEQSTPASAQPDASAGTSPESGVGTHTESPSRSPGGGEQPAAKTELDDGRGGAESAHSFGIAEGSGEANGTRTAELTDAASPWYRRPGILIAAAALIAGVGIVVSGPGEPGTAPGGTTGTSTPWSASFSLIATDFWEPPPAPPARHPQRRHPHRRQPQRRQPPRGTPRATPAWDPPAVVPAPPPPPPPRAGVKARRPVGRPLCRLPITTSLRWVACIGPLRWRVPPPWSTTRRELPFTVTGSAETRIDT